MSIWTWRFGVTLWARGWMLPLGIRDGRLTFRPRREAYPRA